MLPSKIEDFPKLWPSKRPSKFHAFLHRFFIDFGSVLASNMEASWEPRRLKFRKNGFQNLSRSSPRAVLDTNLLLKIAQGSLGIDFEGQRWIFNDFGMIFRTSWLTLGMCSPALSWLGFRCSWLGLQPNLPWKSKNLPRTKPRIQEPAEDKAEKKIRTNASKKTKILQSFVLPNSFPYRNPPYSKNLGRRYSPQGGFN